jgi:hypothetical protein
VNGKTGLEIIAEGQRVKAEKEARRNAQEDERKAREREQAIIEIDELRAKMEGEGADVLSKFVVERATFGKSDARFIRENVIELAVRNDTGRAVSRAYFRAILHTPGREIAWVDSEFNYQISGGIESGESAVWNLRPNMFGEWSKAPTDRPDVLFMVRPVALEGADGKVFASSRFDADDEKRLRALLDSIQYEKAAEVKSKLDARVAEFSQWRAQTSAASAKTQRDALAKRKVEADSARASLAKFVVEKSRFYWAEGALGEEPVIEVTLRNDTGQTVSKFYTKAVLASPGREAPWIDSGFNYEIPGGLKSGERQNLKLAPNRFGDWGNAPKDRNDMILTVAVERLDGAGGERLFDVKFSSEDAAQLTALEKLIEANIWN